MLLQRRQASSDWCWFRLLSGETMVNPISLLLVNLELPSQISDFAPEAVANRRH